MKNDYHDHRIFLYWLAGTMLVAVASVIALVIVVDPYGIYHVIDRSGFNAIKPELSRYQNEIKLTQVIRLRPDVLFLGNSRAEIGFDPERVTMSRLRTSAYNLAIPGTGLATSLNQLEYLRKIGRVPKLIVLGVEFLDFIDPPGKPVDSNVSVTPESAQSVQKIFWRFDSLFSLASLIDAFRTLSMQSNADAATTTSRGFNPLKEYRALTRQEGYYGIFRQKAEENAKSYLKKANGTLSTNDFARLSTILEIAAQSGIEIKLVVYPYHAQVLALFEATGLSPAFKEWKTQVTRELSELRERYPEANVELFDFSGYSSYTCEYIPTKGDRTTNTRWYWEGGHFKKELGDLVLETILPELRSEPGGSSDEVFGFRLNQQNIGENDQRIANERLKCLRDNPSIFRDSVSIVAAARKS